MGIGGCVLVFAAGAILAFGVDWHVNGIDLPVIGVILMIAGALGLLTFGTIFRRRRIVRDDVVDGDIVEERHYRQTY